MELRNTENLLKVKFQNNDFDTYAVLVCYGDEEKAFYSPNADEFTYFDIASMGKVLITSTLILQAISKGLLSLDNKLCDFFGDVPEEKKNITVEQLLTHTSGIVRRPLTKTAVEKGHDGVAEEILSFPLRFQPNTNYVYSCNGMILLGFILEKIYGKTLEEVYQENLYKPLGLKRTSFEIGIDEPNAAVCYRFPRTTEPYSGRFDDENISILGESAGSGGQQSCLFDIKKFVDAVLAKNEKLYTNELFELAEKNYTPQFSEGRGLGYLVVDKKFTQTGKLFPDNSFGHCGHTGQSFFINREMDLYVIILTNATRCLNKKNEFKGYDYGKIKKLREEIHNAIADDLF